jgi:hypothetical protein
LAATPFAARAALLDFDFAFGFVLTLTLAFSLAPAAFDRAPVLDEVFEAGRALAVDRSLDSADCFVADFAFGVDLEEEAEWVLAVDFFGFGFAADCLGFA